MMISQIEKNPFVLHGLYKNNSALQGLNVFIDDVMASIIVTALCSSTTEIMRIDYRVIESVN